jgi:hypothetical protein
MAWANSANIVTTNLDNSSDNPSLARADLYAALVELSTVIQARGAANGIPELDINQLIPNTQIPDTLVSRTGFNLVLSPDTGRVVVDDVLHLTPLTVTQVNSKIAIAGDVVYCSNGAAGNPCVAVYNGTAWKVVALGATISAT